MPRTGAQKRGARPTLRKPSTFPAPVTKSMFLSYGARTSVETLVPHREPSNSLLLEKLLVCAHPKRPSAVAVLSLLVLLTLASPLAGQDRFGAAVTIQATRHCTAQHIISLHIFTTLARRGPSGQCSEGTQVSY